jgi:hypothetical protein
MLDLVLTMWPGSLRAEVVPDYRLRDVKRRCMRSVRHSMWLRAVTQRHGRNTIGARRYSLRTQTCQNHRQHRPHRHRLGCRSGFRRGSGYKLVDNEAREAYRQP